jgi:aminoglycoside phosphotransferase (APT) family kinase protein
VDLTALQKIGEGREAEMFLLESGVVVRLLRDFSERAAARIGWEQRAMDAARAAGLRVPETYGTVEIDGRPGLVMERLEGADLLALLSRKPWRVFWAARAMAGMQATMHETRAPADMPALKDRVARALSSPRAPAQLASPALEMLGRLPDGDRLCHGDLHPANILLHRGELVLIDWANATRGEPAADFARTVIILCAGALPPGSSGATKLLTRAGRTLFRSVYEMRYRRLQPAGGSIVAWTAVRALERLSEGIEEERCTLLRMAGRGICGGSA